MKKEKLPIHFAPLQGYTDAIYRQAHARIFGGIASYYTPFVRIEHGDFRRKDVRELEAENNRGVVLTPQLIASTPETILHILSLFIEKGYQEVDINLGCPFPTLAKRHNGAGLLPYPDEVKALLSAALEAHPDIRFSVKMRLGWEDAAECMALLPLLNSLPLSHITMHPRLGKQQYKGEVDLEAFQRFYAECEKPLVYNGDLLTLDDIERIESRFPRLAGLMIGRGLLANPALAIEYQQGEPLSPSNDGENPVAPCRCLQPIRQPARRGRTATPHQNAHVLGIPPTRWRPQSEKGYPQNIQAQQLSGGSK